MNTKTKLDAGFFMAIKTSGKSDVCKTFVVGSIPTVASGVRDAFETN